MKKISLKIMTAPALVLLAAALLAAALLAAPSFAADITVNLAAVTAQWLPPGGTVGTDEITMWGFIDDPGVCPDSTALPAWGIGPQITAATGDNLTMNLRNCLDEMVSIFILGQSKPLTPTVLPGSDPPRMRSFDAETAPNAVGVYTWSSLKPGTYLYHSGTNLSKQVHMGLYGALTVDAVPSTATDPAQAYPGMVYDNEIVLFYSEIDPALHDPPSPAHPNDYKPRYFLVNGRPYVEGETEPIGAGAAGQSTLVRMLNACLDDIVPTINGMHWDLIAEDGNQYPYAKIQNTTLLSAMKTKDAILAPGSAGIYPVFDRRLNLSNNGAGPGGMLVQFQVGTAGLTAGDDAAETVEDTSVNIAVLDNDPTATAVDSLTQPANGSALVNADQTITYTPNLNFTGNDFFTYISTDGSNISNTASVAVTVTNVNDAPVASDDGYEVTAGETLNVAGPGVLGNDSDPDGDPLTAATTGTPPPGQLTLNADGSFTYTPAGAEGSIEPFSYIASDGTSESAPATVTITVIAAPPAGDPVANDDFAETTRNTAKVIDVLKNDTDGTGASVDPTAAILTVSQGTRGGTVTILTTNSVTYEPRRNFRGTEIFTYSFSIDGVSSNQATVTVNVVR